LSHGVDDDACVVMLVRWVSFGPDGDTWELVTHIPKLLVERYARRNKMAVADYFTLHRNPKLDFINSKQKRAAEHLV
jgi:hypothetical protein